MDLVLPYLATNLTRAPQNVLVDSHFRLQNGPDISPRSLTMTRDGDVYEIEWDEDREAFATIGDPLGEQLELSGFNDALFARYKASDAWRRVQIEALSRPVMQWLLSNSPDGADACAMDADLAADESLCGPLIGGSREEPEVAASSGDGKRTAIIVIVSVVAVALLVLAGYFIWTHFHARAKLGPVTAPPTSTPTHEAISLFNVTAPGGGGGGTVSDFDPDPYLRL